eukprot:1190596-Prorocentrum_minimum.AAC.1
MFNRILLGVVALGEDGLHAQVPAVAAGMVEEPRHVAEAQRVVEVEVARLELQHLHPWKRARKHGYIPTMDQSDAGGMGIFPRWTNQTHHLLVVQVEVVEPEVVHVVAAVPLLFGDEAPAVERDKVPTQNGLRAPRAPPNGRRRG